MEKGVKQSEEAVSKGGPKSAPKSALRNALAMMHGPNKAKRAPEKPVKAKNGKAPERATRSTGRNGRKRGRAGVQRTPESAARIQDVALTLFAKSSFSAVTIKDIGLATGLNTAMIYYYFRDKDDLFRGTVEVAVRHSIEAFEARRRAVHDPEAIITNWLETHIEQLDLIRKFVKISLDYASSGKRTARIDNAIKGFYDDERAILAAAMREGIANKQFCDVDVDQMIDFISTFLDGVMVRSIIFPKFDAAGAIHGLRDFVLGQLHDER